RNSTLNPFGNRGVDRQRPLAAAVDEQNMAAGRRKAPCLPRGGAIRTRHRRWLDRSASVDERPRPAGSKNPARFGKRQVDLARPAAESARRDSRMAVSRLLNHREAMYDRIREHQTSGISPGADDKRRSLFGNQS